ncbi:MAG: hypothetical protein JW950_10525 [Deltaproteobacteria bacterium]|nr:hypothetical protein [Deltaproteobacteria bacterium]
MAIATPKDAATVMILRNNSDNGGKGMEVLMVRRHPRSRFVPDVHVFPGGCLDEGDVDPSMEALCAHLNHRKAFDIIADITPPEKALGAWIAGIRETFEEVGLMMAYEKDGSLIALKPPRSERFSSHRRLLSAGEVSLGKILKDENLILATDRLFYFSHWVTPELSPWRYDVRFFVAEAPENQQALHDGLELTDHVWIDPRKALDEYEKNRFGMVLPTIMNLRELCRFETIEAVIHSTRDKAIPRILTKMVLKDDRYVEVMPDDETVFALISM